MTSTLTRRTLTKGTAWTAPVLVLTAAAPSFASSPGPCADAAINDIEWTWGTSTPYQVGTYDSSGATAPCDHLAFFDSTTVDITNHGPDNYVNPYITVDLDWNPTDDWDTAGHPTGLRFESITVVKNGVATVIDRSTWLIDIGDTTTSTGPRAWVPIGPLLVGETVTIIPRLTINNYSGVDAGTSPLSLQRDKGHGYDYGLISDVDTQCQAYQSNPSTQNFAVTPNTCTV